MNRFVFGKRGGVFTLLKHSEQYANYLNALEKIGWSTISANDFEALFPHTDPKEAMRDFSFGNSIFLPPLHLQKSVWQISAKNFNLEQFEEDGYLGRNALSKKNIPIRYYESKHSQEYQMVQHAIRQWPEMMITEKIVFRAMILLMIPNGEPYEHRDGFVCYPSSRKTQEIMLGFDAKREVIARLARIGSNDEANSHLVFATNHPTVAEEIIGGKSSIPESHTCGKCGNPLIRLPHETKCEECKFIIPKTGSAWRYFLDPELFKAATG